MRNRPVAAGLEYRRPEPSVQWSHCRAIVDSPLEAKGSPASGLRDGTEMTKATAAVAPEVEIDNFAFTPRTITVKPTTEATWTNRDDNSQVPANQCGEGPTARH